MEKQEIFKVRNQRTGKIMYLPKFDAYSSPNYKIIKKVDKPRKGYIL